MIVQVAFKEEPWVIHVVPFILLVVEFEALSSRPEGVQSMDAFENSGCILHWYLCVYAETASLASPAIPGTLHLVSRIRAAAIWEAEAPCSVKSV